MEPSPQLLKFLLQALLIILPSVVAYMLGTRRRVALDRKAEAEVEGAQLKNIESEMGIYKQMMDDLKEALAKVNEDYARLEEQFIRIVEKERLCQEKVATLERQKLEFYQKLKTCTCESGCRREE